MVRFKKLKESTVRAGIMYKCVVYIDGGQEGFRGAPVEMIVCAETASRASSIQGGGQKRKQFLKSMPAGLVGVRIIRVCVFCVCVSCVFGIRLVCLSIAFEFVLVCLCVYLYDTYVCSFVCTSIFFYTWCFFCVCAIYIVLCCALL